jgi:hypothetical protein
VVAVRYTNVGYEETRQMAEELSSVLSYLKNSKKTLEGPRRR